MGLAWGVFGEYAQWHSDKTAKTGFVGFGSTSLGGIQDFLGGFIEGVIVLRSALMVATGLKGVGGPTNSLNYFRQGGGEVGYADTWRLAIVDDGSMHSFRSISAIEDFTADTCCWEASY